MRHCVILVNIFIMKNQLVLDRNVALENIMIEFCLTADLAIRKEDTIMLVYNLAVSGSNWLNDAVLENALIDRCYFKLTFPKRGQYLLTLFLSEINCFSFLFGELISIKCCFMLYLGEKPCPKLSIYVSWGSCLMHKIFFSINNKSVEVQREIRRGALRP